ncbi:heme peroxidase [Infundibulicybe gibba]|nr:heme peroxidase [Infundibulicybe gibba]
MIPGHTINTPDSPAFGSPLVRIERKAATFAHPKWPTLTNPEKIVTPESNGPVFRLQTAAAAGTAWENISPSLMLRYRSLINLSVSDAPISDRLNMLQDAALFMSKEKPDSPTFKEINAAVMALLCKRRPIARLLGSPNIAPPGCHPYALTVDEPPPADRRPTVDTGRVFDILLMARHERPRHKSGASSLVYALANILSLSLFRTREGNSGYNETSPYLDLSALYGANEDEWRSIRVNDGSGMLQPDMFYERRSHLTPTTRALLVIWSRNHNYIAHRLLAVNEGGRWSCLGSLQNVDSQLIHQDDEIFEISRLINCTQFKNVIVEDFAKGLFGLANVGDSLDLDIMPVGAAEDFQRGILHGEQVRWSRAEFSLLYNWSGLMSREDEEWVELQSSQHNMPPLEIADPFDKSTSSLLGRLYTMSSEHQQRVVFYYESGATVLQAATEFGACAPGARSSPGCMRALETRLMDQGREWGVCSLNQFRISLGLKQIRPAFRHFNEWNHDPAIIAAATELYGDVENLELYPGLHAEEAMPGSGFGLGYTLTFALLVDIVSMVRDDPNFKEGCAVRLTKWGYSECQLYRNEGAFHGQLPKVLMRNLAHHYPYNNIYGLFPLTTPSVTLAMLERRAPPTGEPQKSQDPFKLIDLAPYTYTKPPNTQVIILDMASEPDASRKVLEDDTFTTACGDDWRLLTGGYGYILGFSGREREEKKLHDSDQAMILHALMPDLPYLISTTFPFLTDAYSLAHESSSDGSVDLIKDVIKPTYIHWAYSNILGFNSLPSQESQARLYENCAAIYA